MKFSRWIWLGGLLTLSLVGCTALLAPKAPPPEPPAAEAPKPPEPAPSAPPTVASPPQPEPRKEVTITQAPPAAPARPRPTTAQPAAPPTPAQPRGRFVVLNFDNADIETVVHAASGIANFNYVLGPDVRGKVTVQTSSRIPQEEVFNVLLAVLEVHGFTAIKADSVYKIIKLEGARERPVPTIVGTLPDPGRAGEEIITQIVPVRFASVADLATLLRPLISTRGSLVPFRETNLLLITDSAASVRRALEIIGLVDVEVALEELQVIPLKFADAQEVASILSQLFAPARTRPTAAPAAPTPPTAPPAAAPRAPTEAPGGERPPLIVPYRGINVLIVQARKAELEVIRRLLTQLDVDLYGGRRVYIYFVENAKAKDLTATMNAIYGGGQAPPTTAAPTAPTPLRSPTVPAPTPPRPAAAPPASGASDRGLVEGEVRFIADETSNAVIVTTFPRNWLEIEDTLKKLDRTPRQVLIEVLVAEVTLGDTTSLGLEWAVRSSLGGRPLDLAGSFPAPTDPVRTPTAIPFAIPPGPVSGLVQGITGFIFQTDLFFAIFNALASESKVNVLSSPSIMTSENKKAVINVSESVPIATAQQITVGTTGVPGAPITQNIEYRDVGIILTVTPRIGEKGTVGLDIKQEVNDVGRFEGAPVNAFRFNKREAETSVVLLNNQTLVMGGLITNRRDTSRTGIPLLSRIPIFGFLFGSRAEAIEKRELLLLITPRVIGTAQDAARVTEEMKRITPELRESLRRALRPSSSPPKPLEPAPQGN